MSEVESVVIIGYELGYFVVGDIVYGVFLLFLQWQVCLCIECIVVFEDGCVGLFGKLGLWVVLYFFECFECVYLYWNCCQELVVDKVGVWVVGVWVFVIVLLCICVLVGLIECLLVSLQMCNLVYVLIDYLCGYFLELDEQDSVCCLEYFFDSYLLIYQWIVDFFLVFDDDLLWQVRCIVSVDDMQWFNCLFDVGYGES